MIIQWFPGHMTKAQKMIQDNRASVDVFLELVDARAPRSSRNPLLNDMIGDKPRVILLNKIDIADPVATAEWKNTFEKQENTRVVLISSKERQNLGAITQTCEHLLRALKKDSHTVTRGMIVGIPNVGKSTLINALSHAKKAAVAPKPGHTKALQKINLSETFELLDTPGILWHKFEDPEVGQRLAMLGAIKDDVYDFSVIVHATIAFLLEHYPTALADRFKLTTTSHDPDVLLEEIGRKRGYLSKGGGVDLERTHTNLMNDFRSGDMGRISLERP